MACSKLELNAIIDSNVLYLHETPKSETGEPGDIDSIFYKEIIPIAWYSLDPGAYKLSTSQDPSGNTVCDYIPPIGHHYALYSYLDENIPALAVKPEHEERIRISWCRNIMNEIVNLAQCKIDDAFAMQSFDKHWLNFQPEFDLKPGHERSYVNGVGNTKDLQTPSVVLPRKRLNRNQPWFYGKKSYNAFPLFRLNSQSQLVHTYSFDLMITNLLKMEYLEDGQWILRTPDLSLLKGVTADGRLAVPTLYGCFGTIRDNEITWNSCDRKEYRIFGEDIVTENADAVGTSKCGMTPSAEITDENPCKAIFWAAHNLTTNAVNVRANYTTSIYDLVDGDSPILHSSLKFASFKFKELGTNHTTGPLLYHHFVRCPSVNGINGYSFCYRSNDMNTNLGVLLGKLKAKFSVKLEDPETQRWKNGPHDIRNNPPKYIDCQHDFQLTVRMLVMKEFRIVGGIVYDVFAGMASKNNAQGI